MASHAISIQDKGGLERSCPYCLTSTGREFGVANGLEMLRCLRCGTIFTAALPEPGAEKDYDCYYGPSNLAVPSFVHDRLDGLIGRLNPYRRENRWLDVGFGAGALLQAVSRAGWDVRGTEVSQPAIASMGAYGFDVHHGELGDVPYEPQSFDVVTMIEVLEHVPRPDELLGQAFALLRPGGALYLTTPHGRGISARVLGVDWSAVAPPEHLQLASVVGLRIALARRGYVERSLVTHALNPYELLRRMPRSTEGTAPGHARVATSYALNETLSRNAWRRAAKTNINRILDVVRLGDKLKCEAVTDQSQPVGICRDHARNPPPRGWR